MRVLYIINSLSVGGAEKLILDSIPFYEKEGVRIDLVLLKQENAIFKDQLKKNVKTKIFELTKGSIYNPILILRLIPFFKKYELIHVHLFPSLYWVVLAKIFSFSKTKIIYTEHNTKNKRREKIFFKWIDRFIYKKLERIICISQATEMELKKHLGYPLNVNHLKILTINNGVNVNLFRKAEKFNRQELNLKKDQIILTQVSNFTSQKDQDTVINVMNLLSDNYILILIGDGPRLWFCQNLAEELNLNKKVFFLGSRDDIPQLLRMSDIVIQSSHYEGFGLTAVEGMALSKPVIASRVEGLAQIVKGAGLLFRPGSIDELKKCILKLSNEDFYNEVAKRCRERADLYDLNLMTKSYLKIYNELS